MHAGNASRPTVPVPGELSGVDREPVVTPGRDDAVRIERLLQPPDRADELVVGPARRSPIPRTEARYSG